MTKFRAALVAAALALTVAGSAGVASSSQAAPADTGVVKTMKKGGEGWCC